jgi:hypothetical protein
MMRRFSKCAPHIFSSALLVAASYPALAQIDAPASPEAAPEAETAKPVIKHPPSETMMFSIDEFNEIQARLAGAGGDAKNRMDTGIEKADLYLSSILYSGPKDWTIWINGRRIGPNDEFQALQVTAITPNYVELLIPLSAQGMRPVHLGPNQTFIARTGAVVEGRLSE